WLSFLVCVAARFAGVRRTMLWGLPARPVPRLDGLARAPRGLADAALALHDRIPVGDEPGVVDLVGPQPELGPIAVDHYLIAVDAVQDALEVAALPGRQMQRGRELDLRLAPREVPEVLGGAQRAIDARRADLEMKRLRDRVLDIEHRRQLARQVLAVDQIDTLGRDLVEIGLLAERPVHRHAQRPSALLEHEAQLDQLVAGCLANRLDDRDQTLVQRVSGHDSEATNAARHETGRNRERNRGPKKKVAERATSTAERL